MTDTELRELLRDIGERIKASIHIPTGGYTNGMMLGEALEIQRAARTLQRYRNETRAALKAVENTQDTATASALSHQG